MACGCDKPIELIFTEKARAELNESTYLVGYGPFLVYSSAPLLGTVIAQRQ